MARIVHGTTVADEVTEVELEDDFDRVEVVSRDGAAELWFTVDGEDPEVEGDDVENIPATKASREVYFPGGQYVVKLLSSAPVKFTVRGRR